LVTSSAATRRGGRLPSTCTKHPPTSCSPPNCRGFPASRSNRPIASEQYHRIERGHGRFSRAFALPAPIDVTKVAADLKDGVLTVTMPKAARGAHHVAVS